MSETERREDTMQRAGELLSIGAMNRRAFLKLSAGLSAGVAMSTLLAACGGDDDDSDEPTEEAESGGAAATDTMAADEPTATEESASEDEATEDTAGGEEVASDEVLIFGTAVDIPNIDPAVGHDGAISETQKALYDTLYRHLGNPAELVPWLATGHEVTEDAIEWTFTLDENATFQDGSPVTADAVVFSVQRLLEINKGVAWMFSGVLTADSAVAQDEHTVVFTLVEPFAPFIHATAWLFVLNPAVAEEHDNGDQAQDWLLSNSAGSGPFIIKRWEPGTLYEFESDPNYWRGWEQPRLAGYIRQLMRESSTKRLSLENGDIHYADWLSVEDISLLQDSGEIVVPSEPGIGTYSVKLNNQRGPTADINVRRAISYAFDYEAMIEVMEGRAVRLNGPLAPTLQGVNPDLAPYETDIDRAKEELAKSTEWADGFEIEYVYVTGLEEERKTGLIILDQLSQLNITVEITAMEWASAVALFEDPETSPLMFPIYSGSDYPDPDNFLWQGFHTSSAGTWSGASHYSNPEVDTLLEEARAVALWEDRAVLYNQAQEIILSDAAEIFAFSSLPTVAMSTRVQGYEQSGVMGSAPFWYRITLEG